MAIPLNTGKHDMGVTMSTALSIAMREHTTYEVLPQFRGGGVLIQLNLGGKFIVLPQDLENPPIDATFLRPKDQSSPKMPRPSVPRMAAAPAAHDDGDRPSFLPVHVTPPSEGIACTVGSLSCKDERKVVLLLRFPPGHLFDRTRLWDLRLTFTATSQVPRLISPRR